MFGIEELFSIDDYVRATRGEGPLAQVWEEDPARVVLRIAERARLQADLIQFAKKTAEEATEAGVEAARLLKQVMAERHELIRLVSDRNAEIERLRAVQAVQA